MSGEVERIARGLSPAQRKAIEGAWQSGVLGEWFMRRGTRHDVRRRLVDMGLCGKKIGNPLLKRGLAVRAYLQEQQQ
ncbi:hypothetical protein CD928_05755 [Sphingopyxis sp. GW247-27LB]|nr:hypothetical protein CD928_05755 [Sphingopyxis sp. GW247-27LB]